MLNENGYGGTPQGEDPFRDLERENAARQNQVPQGDIPGSQGGSYYSPRTGAVPPSGVYPPPAAGGGKPPKKKKSHKGLKVLGVVAGVALLSFGSIEVYRFASENETIKGFFAKDSSSQTAEGSSKTAESSKQEGSSKAAESSKQESSSGAEAENMSLFELAAPADAMSLPDIVEKVMPSSVGVASTFSYQAGGGYSMWGYVAPQEQEASATGTGIVMSEDGYIITNAHVIFDSENNMGLAKEVQVVLNEDYYEGDTQLAATIIGYDTEEDIAVLKVNTDQKLVAAEFGNSDDLRVGELVVAIGNPLGFDLFGSVTTGVVSALNREVTINETSMNLIQTDAAINSGNSGGPLINCYGQVIGINSAKLSSSYGSASVEGLCFAIPMTHAKTVIDDLINYGYVRGKPLIGIGGVDVTEEISQAYGIPAGILVRTVTEGGAADVAGIKTGDVIIAVNGETVSNYDELNAAKDRYKAGETITLTVTRDNQDIDFSVVLQEKLPTED